MGILPKKQYILVQFILFYFILLKLTFTSRYNRVCQPHLFRQVSLSHLLIDIGQCLSA